MQEWKTNGASFDEIVKEYGPWSAMAVMLSDGTYTLPEAPDFRLRRLVQAAADSVGKPLAQCRVLDLACLEGHYGIEFALQGAEVVCTDIRDANVAKTAFAADQLGLSNLTVYKDDVRNLSPENYGMFDIIVCSGILYHLEAEAAYGLLKSMAACCRAVTLIDTYVAMRSDDHKTIDGLALTGVSYKEHEPGTEQTDKLKDLWASVDNETSFWFTTTSLVAILNKSGYTSAAEILMPTHPGLTTDRKAFVAIKGEPCILKSSAVTQSQPHRDVDLEAPMSVHPSQLRRSVMFRTLKQILPQGVKDKVKPLLRTVGVLPKIATPDWDQHNRDN